MSLNTPADLIAHLRGDNLSQEQCDATLSNRLEDVLDVVTTGVPLEPIHVSALDGTAYALADEELYLNFQEQLFSLSKARNPNLSHKNFSEDVYKAMTLKNRGETWHPSEVERIVDGYVRNAIKEEEMAALLGFIMVKDKEINAEEVAALTNAMTHSGEVYDWQHFEEQGFKVIDKHSTGGISDFVSLVLAPLLAAVDDTLKIPMMSGRGLGHTGGTLDKLEAIPGFNVNLSYDEVNNILEEVGCAIFGQTPQIAPADGKMYNLRSLVNCVASDALIIGSILSKKAAEGTKYLVQDVKTGEGAFLSDYSVAENFAKRFVETAKASAIKTSAIITDMNQPLGKYAGNKLELINALEIFAGKQTEPTTNSSDPSRFMQVTYRLAMELLNMVDPTSTKAINMRDKIDSHRPYNLAFKKFLAMVEMQGGDRRFVEEMYEKVRGNDLASLAKSGLYEPIRSIIGNDPIQFYPVKAQQDGYLQRMDLKDMGFAIRALGAGKEKETDGINHNVGVIYTARLGDRVSKGNTLAVVVHDGSKGNPEAFDQYFHLSQEEPEVPTLIKKIIS